MEQIGRKFLGEKADDKRNDRIREWRCHRSYPASVRNTKKVDWIRKCLIVWWS